MSIKDMFTGKSRRGGTKALNGVLKTISTLPETALVAHLAPRYGMSVLTPTVESKAHEIVTAHLHDAVGVASLCGMMNEMTDWYTGRS